ncbi:hypothetical protein Taro_026551 [Colocasia esculenta]|uniref:Uncharacterized protein n=1 Tax=Colocasia esculenta TaxID=4460 RepID=A0A843VKX9_COLES|nr:hypothetical protein [Colocasia esculenta]
MSYNDLIFKYLDMSLTARLYTTLEKVEDGGYQEGFSSYVHGMQRTVDYKGKSCSLTFSKHRDNGYFNGYIFQRRYK